MKDKTISRKYLNIIVGYTLCFSICCFGVFLPFLQEGKSLMWKQDGLFQTFTAMVYIGDYYKNLINNLLQGGFWPTMIDFRIGLGYDVFTTLNYYGLGDPLLLLTVFFDQDNMNLLYSGLVIFRLYLCGIGFLFYCFKRNKINNQALIGALVYVFSGYAIAAGQRHPYFLNAMIYLPFLLIGIETILKKKKSYLFTIMVLISLVSNFYFFYMLTIMAFIYAVIRLIDIYDGKWKENIVNILIRGVLQYLIGVFLASFALIPTLYAFLNNARGTSSAYSDGLVYNLQYYVKFLYGFISPAYDINSSFTLLGYAPICLILLLFLFLYRENRKKYKMLKLSYVLATFVLFTPLGGYLMNGFSYSSNRWIFGYSFLTAFVVVCMLDEFFKVSLKRLFPIGVVSLLLLIVSLGMGELRERFLVLGPLSFMFLILVFAAMTKVDKIKIKYKVVLASTMISVIALGYYKNSSLGMGFSTQFVKSGEEMTTLENTPLAAIANESDSSFYRVGSYREAIENQSLILGYYGTSSYYSLVDGNVISYLNDMEVTSLRQPHRFYGLEGRSYLEALASVKYQAFEVESDKEDRIPYGYEEVAQSSSEASEDVKVYENSYALPIGYTYENRISTDYYNQLNSVQKQQAMLQAVVVDTVENETKDIVTYSDTQLEYQLDDSNGVKWDKENETITVDDKKSTLTITFNAKKDCETYIRLVGLDIENASESDFVAKVKSGDIESNLYLTNSDYRWDLEKENYLINLGHKKEGETTCTITMGLAGEFKLKDIQVFSLPMTDYENQVTKLGREALTQVAIENNKITGEITVSKDKTLCFGILYNKGWTLKIDGKEADLYKANVMYMATDLRKGSHSVELTYQTPGMELGFGISITTALLLLLSGILEYGLLKYKTRIRKL